MVGEKERWSSGSLRGTQSPNGTIHIGIFGCDLECITSVRYVHTPCLLTSRTKGVGNVGHSHHDNDRGKTVLFVSKSYPFTGTRSVS